MPIPLILIHGYSDVGVSFQKWKELLVATGKYSKEDIHICNYRTLTNEVTIKDIAEGFDRALKIHAHLKDTEAFDAIVHSTGMLVLRSWLTMYGRHKRIKHLVALAPASFGSPLAHKGRSWIGSIFKGNRKWGPDFMEAGDLVLDGLELGSRFTWELAHTDLLDEKQVFYGPTKNTPFVFTFCGNEGYTGLRGVVAQAPGSDGTVRWAGCTLNTRKLTLNYTKPPGDDNRHQISSWPADKRTNLMMPFIPIKGLNHASIIEDPSKELVALVSKALEVNSFDLYDAWIKEATEASAATLAAMEPWQQFLVKARDERGDPITDFNLQLYKVPKGKDITNEKNWRAVPMDVHTYSSDNSYRCFHINLAELTDESIQSIRLEFIASSGTELLGYLDYVAEDGDLPPESQPTFTMDVTPLLRDATFKFFYPFTTTLMEIIINREPKPFRDINNVAQILVG